MRSGHHSAILFLCFSFVVNAQDKDSEKLHHKNIFDSSKLHIIEIEIPKDDWDKLRSQSRSFAAGFSNPNQKPYTYFKGNITVDGKRIESVGIRKKGFFGSADTVRPSLKIKFDEYVEQDPAKGFNRLTLNNNKQDGAQVSQLLTYGIFNKAGIYAPRVSLAKVSVNGESLGVYSNVESVKKPFLKRHFEDPSGNLYEGTITDFYPKAIDRLEVKTNEEEIDKSDIKALADILWSDKFDASKLEKIVDMEYFLKYWAIESLTGFWDGYASNQNNFFLYNNPANGKLYFIPWGADWTLLGSSPFIRRGFGGGGTPAPPTSVYAQAAIPNRLYRVKGYAEKYKAAMTEVLYKAWNEDKLLAEVDRVEKMVREHLHAAQRNYDRSLGQTREFIKSRRKQVTDALADSPVSIPDEPRKPSYNVELGDLKGNFSTTWVNDNRATPSDKSASMQLTLDNAKVELSDVSVVAKPGRVFRFGPSGGSQTPPANLEFRGKRKSNGESVTMTFTVSQDMLKKSTGKTIQVSGRLTEGSGRGGSGGFGGFNAGKQINAQFHFDEASTDEDGAIKGSFTGNIFESRGGMFGRRNNSNRNTTRTRSSSSAASTTRTFQIFDTDKDGEISKDEAENATKALLQLDQNKDGKISRREFGARR